MTDMLATDPGALLASAIVAQDRTLVSFIGVFDDATARQTSYPTRVL